MIFIVFSLNLIVFVKINYVNNFLFEVVFMVKNKSRVDCEQKVFSRGGGYYF